MNTKTILGTVVSTLAIVAAAPAMALTIGDADPGYPGLVNGQHVAASYDVQGKTRAQVKAETLEAIRVGAIGYGDLFVFPTQQQLQSIRIAGLSALPNGQALAASYRVQLMAGAPVMGKTRAQVKAETLEAIRVGAISHGERYVFPTQQQLQSIRTAGLEALAPTMAAGTSDMMKN